jgi:hypothetical protein
MEPAGSMNASIVPGELEDNKGGRNRLDLGAAGYAKTARGNAMCGAGTPYVRTSYTHAKEVRR